MSNRKSEQRSLGRRLAGVTMPIGRRRIRWSRNWPCLCGSNKKYKKCCMDEIDDLTVSDGNASVEKLSENVQEIIDARKMEQEKKGMKENV